MIIGTDGGFYVTYDRMENWDHLNHMAIGQFYHVAVDNRQPYRVYGGLQDNGSWGGPSNGLDGMRSERRLDLGRRRRRLRLPRRSERPGHRLLREPGRRDGAPQPARPASALRCARGPCAGSATASTGTRRSSSRTTIPASSTAPATTSSARSSAATTSRSISPEIARTGRGTGTALAESPRNADVLWVGTDDGNLWVTRDGGANWTNVADKVGLPGPRWVATIEPSRYVEGRCYVAFDAHRSDDDEPYVYVTEDFGETWKSIRANLPTGSTRCLREDLVEPEPARCRHRVRASGRRSTAARHWNRINNNLPTVAIHEIAIHPTAGEMVVATHGRSLWILDVTPLRQMNAEIVKAPAHLYEPNTVVRWRAEPAVGTGGGAQRFRGENPPRGGADLLLAGEKDRKNRTEDRRCRRPNRPRAASQRRTGSESGGMGPHAHHGSRRAWGRRRWSAFWAEVRPLKPAHPKASQAK